MTWASRVRSTPIATRRGGTISVWPDQGLHLDQQGAAALDGREDARAHALPGLGQVEAGRVLDRLEPGLAHLEEAGLVGRAEAVLGGAQDAVGAQVVALEGEDAVDQVLERARAGEAAVLGHLPHEDRR